MNGSFGNNTNRYNAKVSTFARPWVAGPMVGTVATPPAACCGKPVMSCSCSKQ